MNKLIATLICLVTLPAMAQFGTFTDQPFIAEPPPSGPAYLLSENFEDPTVGYENTWVESGSGTYTINPKDTTAPSPLQGTQSLRLTEAVGNALIYTTTTTLNELWFYGQFRVVTLPAAQKRIMTARTASGGVESGILTINASGNLSVALDGQAAFATTVSAMSAGNTYNVWVHFKFGTTAGPVICSVGFSTTGTEPTSGNNYAQNANNPLYNETPSARLYLGQGTSSSSELIWDKIRLNDSPIGDNPP